MQYAATLASPTGKFQMFCFTVSQTHAAPVTNENASNHVARPSNAIAKAMRPTAPRRLAITVDSRIALLVLFNVAIELSHAAGITSAEVRRTTFGAAFICQLMRNNRNEL